MEYTFNIKYLGNFLLLIRDAMNPSTEKKITWELSDNEESYRFWAVFYSKTGKKQKAR